jgi:hypothetical protein
LGFGGIQAIDLSHWRGSSNDPSFRDLVTAVNAKLEGRAAPPARGPAARLMRRLAIGSVASASAAGVFAFAMNLLSVQDYACTAPVGQPLISEACGAVGLVNRPTHEARVDFAALPPGDCAALESYRAQHETSPLRAIADSRLNARVATQEEQWVAGERRLSVYAGGASETEARSRASASAERLCRGFTATTYACEDGVCGISGEAACRLQERQVITRETCGTGE